MTTNKIIALLAAILTGGYLIPFAIALWKGNANVTNVFLVNFLLGWTIIGWLFALYMALKK